MTNEKNQLKPVPTKFIGIIFLVILILFGLTKMLIKIPAGYAGGGRARRVRRQSGAGGARHASDPGDRGPAGRGRDRHRQ